jgi:thymidylate synthase
MSRLVTNGEEVEVRGKKMLELTNITLALDVHNAQECFFNFGQDFKFDRAAYLEEVSWFLSAYPRVDLESPDTPKKWKGAADANGFVFSNYGFLILSPHNGYQLSSVIAELKKDPQSRRAVIYYANPFIHKLSENDHPCTVYAAYTVREGKLNSYISMRSCDLKRGFIESDAAWQLDVHKLIAKELDIPMGIQHWHFVNIHVYDKYVPSLKKIVEDMNFWRKQ